MQNMQASVLKEPFELFCQGFIPQQNVGLTKALHKFYKECDTLLQQVQELEATIKSKIQQKVDMGAKQAIEVQEKAVSTTKDAKKHIAKDTVQTIKVKVQVSKLMMDTPMIEVPF